MVSLSAIAGVLGAVPNTWDLIYPKMKSVCKFRSNLESLGKEMEKLTNLGNTIEQHAVAAERSGRARAPAVVSWLQEFEEIKKNVNSVQARVEANDENQCKGLPTCCLRFTLGEDVSKNLVAVKRLMQAGSLPSVTVVQNYQVQNVQPIPGPSIAGQSTASKNLQKVLDLLNDGAVSKIGVYGMGGVGKTTLVQNLNNKLKAETATSAQSFSIVIWATASKELDMRRLQRQLLERLKLEVNAEESTESTASRLRERLELEKRFLLILDDAWEGIDLHRLGVPQPEIHMGHKIILTTRFLDVCRSMNTDIDVKVDVLDEEESWQLFTEKAGMVASLKYIEPTARKVCKECSGLPLAIITIGASMKGKTTDASWKNALNALQRSVPRIREIEDKLYKSLMWSYDSLFFEDTNIKSCFLYCSLYPEDFSIEVRELVQCWIAEGLLNGRQSSEESINTGIALVENLKESCMLEDGAFKDTVKMHDVIRDVAIWISSSSKDGSKSFVRSGAGSNQISETETLNRISFIHDNITTIPDGSMQQCPKVSSLLLQGNLRLEIVPEAYLLRFPALRVLNLSETGIYMFPPLRVLNLSETGIHMLPLSLLKLTELQALFLRRCHNLKELTEGLKHLTNLRLLDLSHTHSLKRIPNGVISQLSHLEILDMTNSFYKWGAKGVIEEGQAPVEELRCLDQLSAVYIHLDVSGLMFEDLAWMENLKTFHFVIGGADAGLLEQPNYGERRVAICGGSISQEWVKWLLKNASHLRLDRCWELPTWPTDLANEHYFSGLKSLTLTSCYCGFPPAGDSDNRVDLFPNLQELILQNARSLHSISELAQHLGLRFSKLRTIRVSNCNHFQFLFCYGDFISSLEDLEEVTVSSCEEFVGLFVYVFSRHPSITHLNVPNLRLNLMKLKNLPKLTILDGGLKLWEDLEQLEVIECNNVKKLPFSVQKANSIKEIRGELQWWNNLEWNDEDTKSSLHFTPVDTEGASF